MSIIAASKIFTDQNEELTFIVERVRNADKDKVALIIPENALVFSSPVSIKILQRMMYKAEKSPIVVTEDAYGQKFAQKIGLVTVGKTSQITEELWDIAFKRKVKYNNNLRDSEGGEVPSEVVAAVQPEIIEESAVMPQPQANIAQEEPSLEEVDTASRLPEDSSASQDELEESQGEENTQELEPAEQPDLETTALYRKQRDNPKVVTVGGISVYSGGDAKLLKSQFKNVKIRTVKDQDMERTFEPTGSGRFTGKDFTKAISPTSKVSSFFSRLLGRNKRKDLGETPKSKLRSRIILAIVVIVLLTGGYLLLFQFSSVDVRIVATKQDVSATSVVVLDPTVTEIGEVGGKLTMPGKLLNEEQYSASWTGEATGVGRKGNKAGGTVTVFNNSAAAVTIPVGTKILNKTTGKSYTLTEAVTLAAATIDDVVEPAKKENVPMAALEFGPEYNIDTATTQNYSIDGFDDDDVFARSFDQITGGTVQEFTTVSEENITALKAAKAAEFKTQAENKLKSLIPAGSFLIPETIQIIETKVSTVPKTGEESLDDTFSLTIEATVVGILVSNEDFKDLGEMLISDSESSSVVNQLETPQITKVTKGEGDIYTLDITTQGSIGENLDAEQIARDLAGNSFPNAKQYLEDLNGVESFTIRFGPAFIPEFLQFVPSSTDRISIRIN